MINCFYDTILVFDFINKFSYFYKNRVPNFMKIKLVFYFNNLKETVSSAVLAKIINTKVLYKLKLFNKKYTLPLKNVYIPIKKFFLNLLLILVFKKYGFKEQILKLLSFSSYSLILFHLLKTLEISMLFNKFSVVFLNINKYEFNFTKFNLLINIKLDKLLKRLKL